MDVSLIFKLAGIGMLIAVSHQILQKAGRDEQAMMLSLTGVVFVLIILMGKIGELYGEIRAVFGL